MQRQKITYIVSGINKSLEFEWAANYLSEHYEMEFVLLNAQKETELSKYLNERSIKNYFVRYRSKRDLVIAFFKTASILFRTKPSLVNAHLFEATLVGLPAAFVAGVKHRIYTRHHSDLHHVYFPKAVKYDRFCNAMAHHIIAVSDVVKEVLVQNENVKPNKISVIRHGIDIERFGNTNAYVVQELKRKYALEDRYPVVGVISRYTEWKGIQYIIPAFVELLKEYPKACLVLANANGDFKKEIQSLLSKIDSNNYREIEFESAIESLYHCFDIFTHVPVSRSCEAFGQTYIEAMAAGVPSIFTLSGIANEIASDKENSLVVDYRNSQAILNAYDEVLMNTDLRTKIKANAFLTAARFGVERKFKETHELFTKLLMRL